MNLKTFKSSISELSYEDALALIKSIRNDRMIPKAKPKAKSKAKTLKSVKRQGSAKPKKKLDVTKLSNEQKQQLLALLTGVKKDG